MKASVMYEHAKFAYRELEKVPCNANEVKIKVFACGICGSDIHKMQSSWKYGYPAVIGHEFSGQIIEIGKDVTNYKVGDRVVAAPFIPCRKCHYCEQGEYSMCDDYTMVGSHRYGGFSEEVVVPVENLVPIGDLNYEEAAFVEPLAVVMHGVMGIDVQLGDSVVVLGAGTIGLLVMQAAKAAGATKVIVVDIDDKKLELATKLGANYTINSLKENLEEKVAEITNGLGVDISLECAGSPITQEQALLLTRKNGKVGYLGIAYKDVLLREKAFESIFRRQLTLKGFWNSYSAPFPGKEWQNAVALLSNGSVNVKELISHRFSLEEVGAAFDMILGRKETFNKVLIIPNKEGEN